MDIWNIISKFKLSKKNLRLLATRFKDKLFDFVQLIRLYVKVKKYEDMEGDEYLTLREKSSIFCEYLQIEVGLDYSMILS